MKLGFATSGAGKSYLAQKYPEHFVDGDKLVTWPRRFRWFDDPTPEDIVLVNHHVKRLIHRVDGKGPIILYNPRAEALIQQYSTLYRLYRQHSLYIWHVTRELLVKNLRRRAAVKKDQPTNVEQALAHQQRIEDILCFVKPITDVRGFYPNGLPKGDSTT
jgi:hypothetical protein